jgi:hypothetical protein
MAIKSMSFPASLDRPPIMLLATKAYHDYTTRQADQSAASKPSSGTIPDQAGAGSGGGLGGLLGGLGGGSLGGLLAGLGGVLGPSERLSISSSKKDTAIRSTHG